MWSAQHKFGRLGAPAGRSLEAQIAALFPDVWYDPSDLTTLFQDSAGTTPVTALEQPVGLMLDKSRGLVLGPELIPQPLDFTRASWVTVGTLSTVTENSFTNSSGAGAGKSINVTVSRRYSVSVTFSKTESGLTFGIYDGSSANAITTSTAASGTLTANYVATGPVYLRLSGNSTVTIASISVRELPGYHTYHTPGDTTTRPTLSRRINQLTYTEDFSNAAWPKVGCTATAGKLTEDGTNGFHVLTRAGATTGIATVFMVQAKAAERSQIALQLGSSASYYNLATGQVISGAGASMVSAGDGWYWCVFSGTPANSNSMIYLASGGAVSYQGDGTSGVLLRYASIVPADLASLPYQRVNTTTDYDSDASKFPTFLRTDGVNDSLQTNAIDFTGTDKMFVGAAVRKLSDAATGVVAELSASINSNNGTFVVYAPRTAAGNYSFGTKSTAVNGRDYATYNAPITSVLAASLSSVTTANSATSQSVRINGSAVAGTDNSSAAGTGNYGNYPLYLFRRGGSSLPFNGWFYGGLIKGATLSASQIALAERWLASKTKTVVLA